MASAKFQEYLANFFRKKSNLSNYFLITSQGHCATGWLASTLNLHEKISCSHGNEHPIRSMAFYYTRSENSIRTDWTNKLLSHASFSQFGVGAGVRASLEEYASKHKLNLFRLRDRNVADFQSFVFQELTQFIDSPFIGNVHGVTLTNHLEACKRLKNPYKVGTFPVVDLIGDPIHRFEALLNIFESHYKKEEIMRDRVNCTFEKNYDIALQLERQFQVDWSSPRMRCSFYWIYENNIQKWWADEVGNYPHKRITISQLTNKPEELVRLIKYLTLGRVETDNKYLDQVYSVKHQLSGRRHGSMKVRTAEQIFQDWNDWQRVEYTKAYKTLEMNNIYKDFDFFVPGN